MIKKIREKSREYHNRKPQPLPDTKRKRQQEKTKKNKHKSNKRTKSIRLALSSPSEVIVMLKGLKKAQEQSNTRQDLKQIASRINHKATKSKTNTGTTALERSVE